MNEPIHPLQAMVDGMNAQMQRDRAKSQLTLGGLIAVLKAMPTGSRVANLVRPHSYRGYYTDLAFMQEEGTRSCESLFSECTAAMGQVFEGYKGGDFVMGALTPLWVSDYGRASGTRLMAVYPDGRIETEQEK